MTNIPHQNPYWDEHIKPHKVDAGEIRMLCLAAFQLERSSYGVASIYSIDEFADEEEAEESDGDASAPVGEDGEATAEAAADDAEEDIEIGATRLLKLYRAHTERMLSNTLLKIAMLVRTLDDQIYDDDAKMLNEAVSKLVEEEGPLAAVYDLPAGADDTLSLRECCNKIIHAEDFRPTYDNNNRPREIGGWAMDGAIELRGRKGKDEWSVALYLTPFLETVLGFCDLAEPYA